ncbi:MAG: alpha/beta hydrolase [Pseudomonadota bacterium]
MVATLATFILVACSPVPVPEVEQLPTALSSHELPLGDYALHYVESGIESGNSGGTPDRLGAGATQRDSRPLILFVHGTPGSWKAFARYLNDPRLNTQAHLVSVDRLGFGRSAASGSVPSFAEQSRAIGELLEQFPIDAPVLLVGHSLGGSLIYQIAIDYPDRVDGLMSISAPLDPHLSSPRWYNRLALIPGARWVIGQDMARANDEMMPLVSELETLTEPVSRLALSVTLVHGAEDDLVKIGNAEYAEALLTESDVRFLRYEGDSHFIVWERHDEMVQALLALLDSVQQQKNEAQAREVGQRPGGRSDRKSVAGGQALTSARVVPLSTELPAI